MFQDIPMETKKAAMAVGEKITIFHPLFVGSSPIQPPSELIHGLALQAPNGEVLRGRKFFFSFGEVVDHWMF